jgi:SAM-dependent methyltransferase
MGVIGGRLGVLLLDCAGRPSRSEVATAYIGKSKLEVLLGRPFWDEIRDKDVIDFGCGPGLEAVEMAERGARRVIGLELRQKWIDMASQHARDRGVADRCVFAREWHEPVDVIVSLDSFEHFADVGGVLRTMRGLLKPNGRVRVSFGPTWYHPLGGHVYSVFPWSHLLFSESALVSWRAKYKKDGAWSIMESGLNKITIRRFEKLVEESPLRMAHFEAVPIRRLRPVANRFTREFTTATVRCTLVPRESVQPAVPVTSLSHKRQ